MNTEKVYQSLLKIITNYRARLPEIGEEDFTITPTDGGWSYSEVYAHIFDASLLSLIAMANCIKGDGENKPTAFAVKVILFFGSLPPGKKYKAPKRLVDRVKKINTMAAQQLITDFELQLVRWYPEIKNANQKIKTKHPRLGYLNAQDWLRFIEIHLKHHFKQLIRIDEKLKTA